MNLRARVLEDVLTVFVDGKRLSSVYLLRETTGASGIAVKESGVISYAKIVYSAN